MEHTEAYLRIQKERYGLKTDIAPQFSGFGDRDQDAVLWIWNTKQHQGELDAELVEDHLKGIEAVAQLYHKQKCAFQDVLAKEGFDLATEVLKTYNGRVAVLTDHGSFLVLGKPKTRGRRHIAMTRIHTPTLNRDGGRGFLENDLKINGSGPHIACQGGYNGSDTRALAINPYGADGDELEVKAAETLLGMVDSDTYAGSRIRPVYPIEVPVGDHKRPLEFAR